MTSGSNMRSLIERAADVYDFDTARRHGPAVAIANPVASTPAPALVERVETVPAPARAFAGARHDLDRARLAEDGFLNPQGPPTGLSEEFRIIKRQLLAQAFAPDASPIDRLILVNSAHPGDGKSWTAINLALSLSAESDIEVLLIDADFGKPSICAQLGLPNGPGFMDALVDPAQDLDSLTLRTDIPTLHILPGGRQVHNDTEVLASERTRALLTSLVAANPRRIVLFDSPPALAASAASELARHVGTVLLVVRADRTSDVALRDAVQLLSACPNIQAVLNGVKFSSSGRLFGSYYKKRAG